MFKKILALLLATMMVLGGMVTVSAAEETPAAEEEVVYDYTAAAEDLAALGIFKGKVDGNTIDFALEDGVTRLQMALFIARIMTGETNDSYWSKVNDNTTPYDDVVNYFGAVSFADENGIILGKGWIPGVGDNCFDPNGAITYQDAITMAVRALGYKQLQYPNGFLTVGEELGLTTDLEPLAGDAELNRGQMIQILKNMLYVKVEGAASFAEQNFGLEETTYVIVATETQFMPDTERVTKPGYVKLAKLNANGTFDYGNYIHLTEEELGLADGEAELKMGYSYTIRTYNEYAGVYEAVINETKTVKNYGDAGLAITAGSKYLGIADSSIVKIDGITYNLVTDFSNLNNKSTSVGVNDELIVHSMYAGSATSAFTYYIYDTAFNILDSNGEIALWYNSYTGTYYAVAGQANGNNYYRPATNEDFEKYAIAYNLGSTSEYGIVTSAKELYTIQFSEITLIDDNNDGKWDRAIYIPYSVGQYKTNTSSNDYRWNYGTSTTIGKNKQAAPYINGEYLNVWSRWSYDGQWYKVGKTTDRSADVKYYDAYGVEKTQSFNHYVRQDDIIFDLAGEGRPANNEFVVYYYNPYSRVFVTVENLGKAKTGVVTNATQGTYAYDATSMTYYYNGSSVTIDGTTYKIGYRPYTTNSQYDSDATDLGKIDTQIANYGYDDDIYGALLGNAYRTLSYVVLEGRVIYASDSSLDCEWIAFDYGTYTHTEAAAGVYTDYDYDGDIVGVDADGNILVKAYADDSGEQQIVKIGAINGFNYGLLVEDYAALQYQFSGITMVSSTTKYEEMKKVVICDFFKTLTADLNAGVGSTKRQYVFIVTGISADGVYDIYTDLDLYWGANYASEYRQPGYVSQSSAVQFYDGISTAKVRYKTNSTDTKVLILDSESVIVVAGTDGMKVHTGVPADGAYLAIDGKVDGVRAYSLNENLILVASSTKNTDQIFYVKNADGTTSAIDWDNTNTSTAYTYYVVTGRPTVDNHDGETALSANWDVTTGKYVYTYTKMYNVNTGSYETLPLTEALPGYSNANALQNNKPIGAIYAEKDGVYTLLTTQIDTLSYNYGLYTKSYRAAEGSVDVLTALLYTGYTTYNADGSVKQYYAPIYDSADSLNGKAVSSNILKLKSAGNIYDTGVTFKFDYFVADDAADADADGITTYGTFRLNTDNAPSTDVATAALYYTYEAGKSFSGVAIYDDAADAAPELGVKPVTPVDPTTLTAAQNAAIEALTEAAEGYPAAEALLDAAETAIKAATTVAEVNSVKSIFANEIAKLTGVADDLKDAQDAAIEKIDNAVGTYKTSDYVDVAQGTAKSIKYWYDKVTKAINACTTVAEVEALKVNDKTVDEWATRLATSVKNAIAAGEKAEADAVDGVVAVKNENGKSVIAIQNMDSSFATVEIYNVNENGTATKWAVVTLTGGANTLTWADNSTSGAKVEWVRTPLTDDGVLTLYYVDAFGVTTPVLTSGNQYKFITTGDASATEDAIICG